MRFDGAEFECAFGTVEQIPPSTLPEIVFSGRSNVGKSSLINKLVGRKALARTSATPGKTITINFYRLNDTRFVDLPGYGYAKVSHSEKARWSAMMEHFFRQPRNIKLVVQLVDMRHPPTKDDIQMLTSLRDTGMPFIVALTKSDKLNKTEREKRLTGLSDELAFLGQYTAIPFSARDGEGVPEIREQIEKAVTNNTMGV